MTPEILGLLALTILVAISLIMWQRRGEQLEKLQQQHREFEGEESRLFLFLHKLGEFLYEDQPVQKIQKRIVDGVRKVISAERGGILYVVDKSGNLIPAYASKGCTPLIPLPEEVVSQHATNANAVHSHVRLHAIGEGEGMIRRTFDRREVESIERISDEPELREYPLLIDEQRDVGAMIAPLCYGRRPLGVLAVMNHCAKGGFSAHDFEVFKSAAEQSAFALGSVLMHQEVLDKRRIEDELRSAREIQKVLLPSREPEFAGWRFSGTNVPASVVSGDYYDYIDIDADHHGVVIADVSGKGIPASLVMATCRGLVRMNARDETSPVAVLNRVNRIIFGDIREDMFISMAYCILKSNGEVTLARAGHDPPLIFRKRTGTVERLKPPGLAVGVDRGNVFERVTKDSTTQMESGDCLLLYTDGATDALDENGAKEFSLSHLEESFGSAAPGGPDATLEALTAELKRFIGDNKQMDDITLIAIERQ